MPDEHAPALVTRSSARPGLLGDLADRAFLENPYPAFRRLLAESRVLREDAHGMWLVAGHAEVLDALKHPAASVATAAARIAPALGDQATRFALLINAVSHFLTRLDPPDHTRLRALLTKAFTVQAVERMHQTMIALVEEYLGPRVKAGELDLMADLAVPLPMTVSCRMLGIPPGDQARIKGWSDNLASGESGKSSHCRDHEGKTPCAQPSSRASASHSRSRPFPTPNRGRRS